MITKEEVIKRCETVFDTIGLNVSDEELMGILDSVQYISALVELEAEFGFQFPEAMLSQNMFLDMDGFYDILTLILQDLGK